MALTIEGITELFHAQGAVQYDSETINQQQHALQDLLGSDTNFSATPRVAPEGSAFG